MKPMAQKTRQRIKAALLSGALLAACFLFAPASARWQIQAPQFTPNAPTTEARYVGNAACAQCHKQQTSAHAASAMGQALFAPSESQILQANPQLKFALGPWTYEIKRAGQAGRTGGRSLYTVSDGQASFTAPILWAFGRGHSGQTFVIERDGTYYETRVSFFTELKALDFTPGAPRDLPASVNEAIGQRMSQADALSCFGCHATVAPGAPRFALDRFTPGVGCEACHGPGERHVALMKEAMKAPQPTTDKAIFNPRAMHPDDLSQQFCGACHRSWETVMGMPGHGGQSNVRFQPYRLANSRCYKDPDDHRISCTACHDPHADPQRNAAFYDAKCTACHQTQQAGKAAAVTASATAPRCPVGTANCASCHMPKIEAPGVHFKFTDHQIRVVKAGEQYPK